MRTEVRLMSELSTGRTKHIGRAWCCVLMLFASDIVSMCQYSDHKQS
jgi:hypothetical protein